jgi:hypothetical protein
LPGRIQTRIFSLAIIGSIVQLIFSGILPDTEGAPLGTMYKITFSILITTIVLGIVWEFIYQGLMQFRWEKDWPTFFGLITVINEGAVVWFLIKADIVPGVPKGLPFTTFVTDFLLVWLITFFWLNGPMRVPFISWRHSGGRLV